MIIVTGGAGFIGSVLLSKLNAEGRSDILVVDNLGETDKWKNLVKKDFDDFLHKDDFLSLISEDRFSYKVDCIFHLGACTSTIERDANYMMENNYRYTGVLAEWCVKNRARFIYASSAATYGDGSLGFSDEHQQTAQFQPLNVYAFSKHLFDLWAIRTGTINKMTGVKFFNVFGPNEGHKAEMRSVVLKAFEQIRQNGKLELFKSYNAKFKDGEQQRDFVYVKDCVEVLWWMYQNKTLSGLYNLGSGRAESWNQLAGAVFKALGLPPKIEYIDMPTELRDRYQYYTKADLAKLRAAGCTVEFRSLENAVDDYVKNHLLADKSA